MTDKAYAVPLHEQLASVPRDARLIIDDADGRGTRFIPVGRMCHEAAEALRARLSQPEPVAWRTFDGEGGYEFRSYEMNENYAEEWAQRNPNHKGWVEPLYKDPTPCQTCESLARTVMMDQTSHDTAPPQREFTELELMEIRPGPIEVVRREWQGLTDEEMEEAMKYWSDPCRSAYGGAEAADDEYVNMIGTWRYIEAKLKEKNS